MLAVPQQLLSLGWNQRQLTYTDFEAACEQHGIRILRANTKTLGMYFICEGIPHIGLSTKLCGVKLWFVAWHEFVHHLLHPPGLRCFTKGTIRKIEYEAHSLAICAVIDEDTLYRILANGELHDFPKDMMKLRMKVMSSLNF